MGYKRVPLHTLTIRHGPLLVMPSRGLIAQRLQGAVCVATCEDDQSTIDLSTSLMLNSDAVGLWPAATFTACTEPTVPLLCVGCLSSNLCGHSHHTMLIIWVRLWAHLVPARSLLGPAFARRAGRPFGGRGGGGGGFPTASADYALHGKLGEGVTATVYLATCKPLRRTVAVKLLDLEAIEAAGGLVRRPISSFLAIPLSASPTIGGNFGPRPPGSHAALSPAMYLSAVTLPAILFGASYMTGTGSAPSPLDMGCTPPPRRTGCYSPPPLGSSYDTRRECTDRPRPSQFMDPQCMGRTARSTDAVQERDCKSAIWPCSDVGVGPGQNRGLPSVAEFFLVRTHHLHLHCIR